MASFLTTREAKDYLAGRIADEAKSQDIPLSEIERQMLYFSETDWTLPGMLDINAEFERSYDTNEYEQKIASLVRSIEARNRANRQDEMLWDEAVNKLNEGDNYLSIMLSPSFAPIGSTVRPPHDRLKLWLTAFAIVFGSFGAIALLNWLFGPKFWEFFDWPNDHRGGLGALAMLAVIALLYYVVGPKLSAAFDRLFTRK